MSKVFYQLMTLWLKTWLYLNNSVADECQMNPDVKKWTSMSEERYYALLEDWLFILIFPSI